jgi:hypothetical protein
LQVEILHYSLICLHNQTQGDDDDDDDDVSDDDMTPG